jgi:hypothetical protein
MIKQMIRLSTAFAEGATDEINAIKAEMGSVLTDELIAAASYGRFKAYNDPPPEKKNSPTTIHKDKMKAARERELLDKSSQDTATLPTVKARDGPFCA